MLVFNENMTIMQVSKGLPKSSGVVLVYNPKNRWGKSGTSGQVDILSGENSVSD